MDRLDLEVKLWTLNTWNASPTSGQLRPGCWCQKHTREEGASRTASQLAALTPDLVDGVGGGHHEGAHLEPTGKHNHLQVKGGFWCRRMKHLSPQVETLISRRESGPFANTGFRALKASQGHRILTEQLVSTRCVTPRALCCELTSADRSKGWCPVTHVNHSGVLFFQSYL